MKMMNRDEALHQGRAANSGVRIRRTPVALVCSALLAIGAVSMVAGPARADLTLRLVDYATMPMTGTTAFPAPTANSGYLARVNFVRDNPANPNQFWVNDLNGPLYLLDKQTRQFTEYLNFNGRGDAPGLFEKFYNGPTGFAAGLITFQFDPGYADPSSNGYGKFYTVHMEETGAPGSTVPNNVSYPEFNTDGYTSTTAVTTPGSMPRQTVLIEWSDTNIHNNAFEGTARELLRLNMHSQIHPMGDLLFNPTAGPGDPDWRVMYIAVGDGGAGEVTNPASTRRTPQLLNVLGGKILRIIPDLDGGNIPSTVSPNGRYHIPDDNPFTSVDHAAVRDEIWALGLRNPHRLTWDVDPANPESNHLIVNDIGLRSWEEVNIIHGGANYGYSEREGNEQLLSNNTTGPLPSPDTIPKDLICTGGFSGFSNCTSNGTVTPRYPVLQYGHALEGQDTTIAGDAISSGFVYRGSRIPSLYGKYVFGDISTGALYYADFEEMLAADDGDPNTLATIHSISVLWDSPFDPETGEQLYSTTSIPTPGSTNKVRVRGTMFEIVKEAYDGRGGMHPELPGFANITAPRGRADIRLAMDAEGELYVLSKADGMIRLLLDPERILGDYNYDGVVDERDYDAWRAASGSMVHVLGFDADGNGDGVIDAADYVLWRKNLLPAVAASTPPAVPEPGSAWLMIAAGLAGLSYRRR